MKHRGTTEENRGNKNRMDSDINLFMMVLFVE